jgi:hypothetical protein
MTAKGRTLPLDLGPANGRSRRNLVARAGPGEGPQTTQLSRSRRVLRMTGIRASAVAFATAPRNKPDYMPNS